MDPKYNKKVGDQGEQLAAQFLFSKGFTLVAEKYRCPYGEIDLIVENNQCLVFVEVKTRTNKAFGYAEEAVSYSKQQKIRKTIEFYLVNHETNKDIRCDVVVVELFTEPKFRHFEAIELA